MIRKKILEKCQNGFLLIELIVALFIFSMVMTISIGSIITIFDANKKSQSLQSVMNNLNLAMDSTTKALAVGTDYKCLAYSVGSPVPDLIGDCDDAIVYGGISFQSQDGENVSIFVRKSCFSANTTDLSYGCLVRRINNGAFVPVSAPEIKLNRFEFFVSGTHTSQNGQPDDEVQPRVSIFLSGTANAGPRNQTTFSLQTTVSQRTPDSPPVQGRGLFPSEYKWSVI